MIEEFLSSNREIHAFGIGVYHGFIDIRDWSGLPDELPDENDDVDREPHYAKGGYVLGAVLRIGCVLLLGSQIIP
jgi:hypothetical protein